jgi:hypothetical protein
MDIQRTERRFSPSSAILLLARRAATAATTRAAAAAAGRTQAATAAPKGTQRPSHVTAPASHLCCSKGGQVGTCACAPEKSLSFAPLRGRAERLGPPPTQHEPRKGDAWEAQQRRGGGGGGVG